MARPLPELGTPYVEEETEVARRRRQLDALLREHEAERRRRPPQYLPAAIRRTLALFAGARRGAD